MFRHKMVSLSILLALVACGRSDAPGARPAPGTAHDLAVGQVWEYRNRPGDDGSTLTIGRLEDLPKIGSIVHISIAGVHVKDPGVPGGQSERLPHAPFSRAAFEGSITLLVGRASPPAEFEAGYQQWQRAHGGVFTISVAEAVDLLEKGINK